MKILDVVNTPNPNAVKVMLDGEISEGTKSYFNAGMAKDDPLATQLFGIEGVTSVMLLGNFITVSKHRDAGWETILPAVKKVLGAGI